MGRLRYLEVENFKSYNGKQMVGPFDNFTCIVGPNGAGKSNMMDAVSFVLGVQSRHLRSSTLKGLIFRRDANSPPARKASVKLVYQVGKDEVAGMAEGSEIHFSRSISAAGVSTYRLGDKEVTYEQYENLLQEIGVLVKVRNFLVFQGDVETVASKSPAELTKLLEQISTSDNLRSDYEELLKKKNETEESSIFMMQKKKMYAAQRKEVKEQKDEAETYIEKQNELNDLKTELTLWQIWTIKVEMERHQDACESLRVQLADFADEEKHLDDLAQAKKQSLAKTRKTLSGAEKDLNAKKKLLDNVSPQLDAAKTKLTSLRKRLAELGRSVKSNESEMAKQAASVQSLKDDIVGLEAEEARLNAGYVALAEGDIHLDDTKIAEYNRLREEAAARTAAEKAQENTMAQEVRSKQQQIQRMRSQTEAMQKEAAAGGKLLADYEARLRKLRGGLDASNQELAALQRERDAAGGAARTSAEAVAEDEQELERVTKALQDLGDQRRRTKQEEKLHEALTAMQQIFPGVYGRLADLCQPTQKKYSQAISTASGRQMDAIVVATKVVAKECIAYLRDQRVGVSLFLPLDNISPKPVPERLRSLGGGYRLCLDLIECEERFKPAVAYAVGATVVCDTLEDAQELAFRRNEKVKVVTLKGHVIGKSGAMTGGTSSNEAQDRWEEREFDKLQRKKADLEKSIAEYRAQAPTRQHIVDLETQIVTMQVRSQYTSKEMEEVERKLREQGQQRRLKEDAIARQQAELGPLEADLLDLEARSQRLHDGTREIETVVFAEFSRSVGVASIRDFEETQLKRHKELVSELGAVTERKAALVAQLEYESNRDLAAALKRVQDQVKGLGKEMAEQEGKEKELIASAALLRTNVDEAAEVVEAAVAEQARAADEAKELQTEKAQLVSKRDATAKQMSGEEILLERARMRLHEVLQRAQVEEIALPAVDMDDDDEEESGSAGSASTGLSQSQRRRNEDFRWEGTLSQTSSRFASQGGRNEARNRRGHDGDEDEEDEGAMTARVRRPREGGGAGGGGVPQYSQSDNPAVVRDRRRAARVDLSSMEKHKKLTKQQVSSSISDLEKSITKLSSDLQAMQPNMHAVERYDGVVEKLKESADELERSKEGARHIAEQFEDVKNRRRRLFQECYDHVSESLKVIYQDLTRSTRHPLGGNAYLTLDNTDEPYLGGIRFTAMPPMKRFRDMDQLSGGEKTIAALALLFSIHSYRQAPFFVLDEVDAALDNVNVKKICNYIRHRSGDFQCVVISLKDMFFEQADCLVGICKDVDALSSKIFTLNLKQFDGNKQVTPSTSASVSVTSSAQRDTGDDRSGGSARSSTGGVSGVRRRPEGDVGRLELAIEDTPESSPSKPASRPPSGGNSGGSAVASRSRSRIGAGVDASVSREKGEKERGDDDDEEPEKGPVRGQGRVKAQAKAKGTEGSQSLGKRKMGEVGPGAGGGQRPVVRVRASGVRARASAVPSIDPLEEDENEDDEEDDDGEGDGPDEV